jgi:hypothetical protein
MIASILLAKYLLSKSSTDQPFNLLSISHQSASIPPISHQSQKSKQETISEG